MRRNKKADIMADQIECFGLPEYVQQYGATAAERYKNQVRKQQAAAEEKQFKCLQDCEACEHWEVER